MFAVSIRQIAKAKKDVWKIATLIEWIATKNNKFKHQLIVYEEKREK